MGSDQREWVSLPEQQGDYSHRISSHYLPLKHVLPIEQLWINPDCGLKTRTREEVRPTLSNMVQAVKRIRSGSV